MRCGIAGGAWARLCLCSLLFCGALVRWEAAGELYTR